jgi:hypothetical protein
MTHQLRAVAAAAAIAGGGALLGATSQPPDPLAAMRTALGGETVLDGVKTWSASGNRTLVAGGRGKVLSLEQLAMLPEHFLEIRRDFDSGGPIRIDITYYNGFAGTELLRRTDSTIPFPPDSGRARDHWEKHRRDFQRLMLVLTGRLPFGGDLSVTLVGQDTAAEQPVDVFEVRAADGFLARLYVNQKTHLPVVVAWLAPPPVFITTSSSAVVGGGRVLSQSPAPPVNVPDQSASPDVTWSLWLSDYKTRDGVTWPHKLQTKVGDRTIAEEKISRYRLNPRIDQRRFNVGR